jgi:hypothetical protein
MSKSFLLRLESFFGLGLGWVRLGMILVWYGVDNMDLPEWYHLCRWVINEWYNLVDTAKLSFWKWFLVKNPGRPSFYEREPGGAISLMLVQ